MKATVSYCLCRIICTERCVAKPIYFNQMLVVYCEKRRIFDSILQYIVLISRGRAIRGRCVRYLVNTYIVWVNMFLVRLNQEIEPRYYRFRLWPNVCLSGLFYDPICWSILKSESIDSMFRWLRFLVIYVARRPWCGMIANAFRVVYLSRLFIFFG